MLRRSILMLVIVAACSSAPTGASPTSQTTPLPTTGPTNSAPSVAGYAGESWQATAIGLGDQLGGRFTYHCPADGVNWFIYGTDIYTSDSSVCTAAVHMGLVTLVAGGDVTIEIRPGQADYVGSVRNDISSAGYGAWEASFVFVDGTGAVIIPATQSPATPAPTTASSSDAPAVAGDLIQAGQLSVCLPFDRIRFAERDANGQPFGVDVEIGQAVAAQLVLQPVFVETAFDDLIDAVRQGACDVSIGGQFITAARLELIDMIPYRQGTQHVVVRAGNPLGITELADLCGRTVAIVEGTIHVDILADISTDCATASQPPVDASEYLTESDAEDALRNGDANAYLGNDFVTVDEPDQFELSAALPPLQNGIGHRLESPALDAAIRQALRTIIGDGTYDDILERYNVAPVRLTELP